MKKILSIFLTFAMVFSLAACGSNKTEPTTQPVTEATAPAQEAASSNLDAISPDDILYLMGDMNPDTGLGGYGHQEVTEENAGFLIGYPEFAGKFESAMALMPAMNVDPFIMIAFRLAEGADAEAFADDLLTNANPGKWVCVRAEAVTTRVSGRTVLFMMSSQDLVKPVTDTFATMEAEGFDADAHMVKPLAGKTVQDVYDELYSLFRADDFGFMDNENVTVIDEAEGYGLNNVNLSAIGESILDDGYVAATEEDGEQAYVLALIRLNDGEDEAAFAQSVIENLDLTQLQGDDANGVVCYGDGFVMVYAATGNYGIMATSLGMMLPIDYRVVAQAI